MSGRVGGSSSSDLQQPLLGNNDASGREDNSHGDDEEQQRTTRILEEWNASVSSFVTANGGDDNVSCYLTEDGLEPPVAATTERTTNGQTGDGGAEHNEDNDDDDDSPDGDGWSDDFVSKLATICRATLFPDDLPAFGSGGDDSPSDQVREEEQEEQPRRRSVEPGPHIKFLKLVLLTFGSIALVRRAVVALGISDRDQILTFSEILVYEGDSILRDLAVFFVVGRLHHRRGIDTLEWLGFGFLANLYFESQAFVGWMQHSVTPYEMHCLWPWQLWAFAVVVVLGIAVLLVVHAVAAVREGCLGVVLLELLATIGCFVLPVVASPYAHFHHWFAGWLFGMHANFHHKWWSRAAMAYCWGTYVNGIAVYGRDPLLTCDYARFVVVDQNCPIPGDGRYDSLAPSLPEFGRSILSELVFRMVQGVGVSDDPDAPDWRNCSSSGYHP